MWIYAYHMFEMLDASILKYFIGPLVGAVIGYITNDIAIKMLFRPYNAVRVFGVRLPFTPGLIPKERRNIAKSIGETISTELLSGEIVRGALLSESARRKLEDGVDAVMSKAAADERRVREVLPGGEDGAWKAGLAATLDNISGQLCQSLLMSGFEKAIAAKVIEDLRAKLAHSPISPMRLFWDDNFSNTLSNRLSRSLSEFTERNAPELVSGLLTKAADDILNSTIGGLFEKYGEQLTRLRGALLAQYESLVTNQIDNMLRAINIRAIVEDRINSLDMAQLEAMTFRLMKRELKAIVWLGALLGAIMGTATSFIK